MVLMGAVTEVHKQLWSEISRQDAENAKKNQLQNKKEFLDELYKEKKLRSILYVKDMVLKYNIQQVNDLSRIPGDDYDTLMGIYSLESITQKILDKQNTLRREYETQCRDPHNGWSWIDLGIVSYIRNELSTVDKAQIMLKNKQYLKAGIVLLNEIFKLNGIPIKSFKEMVEDVMECRKDKINTLYFVGMSDAGKSTLSKIIGTPFLKGDSSISVNICFSLYSSE